jgi:hypothetical protein
MSDTKKTARDLLLDLGVGQYNATQSIPYMLIAPATTDPKAAQIIIMVRHLQELLFRMGATDVQNTGYLDAPTARALRQISGENWERMNWGANIAATLNAHKRGQRLTALAAMSAPMGGPVAIGGPLDFLPDVPGGLLTYGVVGYFLYRHFKGARR